MDNVAVISETSTRSNAKEHSHRCQKCGLVWSHGDELLGDVEAHTCPRCGAQEWRKYRGKTSDPVVGRVVPAGGPVYMIDARELLGGVLLAVGLALILRGVVALFED